MISVRRRPTTAIVVIVAIGFGLRLGWVLYAARNPFELHDPLLYRLLSDAVARGHGYSYPPPFNGPGIGYAPTAYYPPGYPMLLGGLEWLTLHTPLPEGMTTVVSLVNLVAGTASILLVYGITRRLTNERTGLVAAGLVALWPNLIAHTALTLGETVFIALLLLAVWLVVRLPALGHSWGRLAAVGAVLGLATLVRPVALPLVAAFAIAWLIAGVPFREVAVRAGVITVVCVAVLVPWVIRNASVMGSPVLSTNTGDNLCMSRQPGATGGFELTTFCNSDLTGLHRPASEIKKNDDGQHKAIAFVRHQPVEELRLWVARVHLAFQNDADGVLASESYNSDRFLPGWLRTGLTAVANGWYAIVGVLAVVSLWWWLRRREIGGWLIFLSAVGVGVVPVVVFFGDPRFHVPIDPLIAILAAGLLSGWLRRPAPEPASATSSAEPVGDATPPPLPAPAGG